MSQESVLRWLKARPNEEYTLSEIKKPLRLSRTSAQYSLRALTRFGMIRRRLGTKKSIMGRRKVPYYHFDPLRTNEVTRCVMCRRYAVPGTRTCGRSCAQQLRREREKFPTVIEMIQKPPPIRVIDCPPGAEYPAYLRERN